MLVWQNFIRYQKLLLYLMFLINYRMMYGTLQKRKMLESKPKELAIYPLFTDSKEALIYIRYQEMNKGVKAIPNTERAKCLSYFETKINKNEIKHDADSIGYLTLLEACHKQTMHR